MIFGVKRNQKDMDGLSFEAEIARRSYLSERFAWALAIFFAILVGLAVGALYALMPLKQVMPYFVFVDRETGVMQQVVVNDTQTITSTEALSRYWLNRYVQARERYVYRLLQDDYDFVMVSSEPPIGREFSAQYEGPSNRAEQIKESIEERINVLSVQVLPGQTGRGTVRFQKIKWRLGQREPESVKTYVADIAFAFKNNLGKWTGEDLLKNPVGFTVTGYRVTQEFDAK